MHQAEFLQDAQPDLPTKKDVNSKLIPWTTTFPGSTSQISATPLALLSCGFLHRIHSFLGLPRPKEKKYLHSLVF